MGLIGVPDVDVAAADATTDSPADARSPVVVMAAAEGQRQMLAEQQARQQAIALRAARRQAQLLAKSNTGGSLTFNGSTTVQPTTGGAIPTTQVTAKTRQIQSLVKKYFPADQLGNAMAVSACESGHSDAKGAVNSDGTIDWGVFQLNDGGIAPGIAGRDRGVVQLDRRGAEARWTLPPTSRPLPRSTPNAGGAPMGLRLQDRCGQRAVLQHPGPMDGKFDAWANPP